MSKNIIRVSHNKDNPYVVMNKLFFSDVNLSWKAKGLLGYLLSKPDDWEVIIENLINQSTDGEKSVRSGLNELKEYNYLQRYPVYINGLVDRWESIVYEQPYEGEKIKSLYVLEDGKYKVNLLSQNGEVEENQLLTQNLQVDNVEVGNLHVEKEGLLYNDNTNNDSTKYLLEDEEVKYICNTWKDIKGRKVFNSEKVKFKILLESHSKDLILKAIDIMVTDAEKITLKYIISTLEDWKTKRIQTVEEVDKIRSEWSETKRKAKENKQKVVRSKTSEKPSNFNNFKNRDYDFDKLERQLLGWDKEA